MSTQKFTQVKDPAQIVKPESTEGGAGVVRNFEFPQIGKDQSKQYSDLKKKYGSLAITDTERKDRKGKDARFQLNTVQKESLSIDEEERRAVEHLVEQRVSAVREEAKKEGFSQGNEAGFKEGKEEAFREVREKATTQLSQLEKFLASCENSKAEIFAANEKFLIHVLFQISKVLFLKDVSADRQYVTRLARTLVDRAGVRENIRLKINPIDKETIGQLKEELVKSFGEFQNLNIEVTESVELGGCQLETEWNTIDASIATQLKNLAESLQLNPADAIPAEGKPAP